MVALTATAAAAQSQTAAVSIQVQDSLAVTTIQPMRFNNPGLHAAGAPGSGLADSPAVIQVSGGAGRAYRISLPPSVATGAEAAVVDNLTAWSANAGDISVSRSGRMDAEGRDTLRVGGSLHLTGTTPPGAITASVSLGVDYQ